MIKHPYYLFIILCLIAAGQVLQAQDLRLEPNRPIDRKIAGGDSHTYQIPLTAGQFLRVAAEQREINVTLVLATPNGEQSVEMNLTRAGALESLSEEAAASGDYRLTIRADGAATLAGSYQLRLETRAAATAQDKQRIAAERLMREAYKLQTQGRKTAEPAINKLEQALLVWRELNDPYWVAWSLLNIGAANSSLGRYEKANEYHEQALAIYRELKNRAGEGTSLNNLGGTYYRLSSYEKAIDYLEQALAIHREVKDRAGEGTALNNLGIANYGMSRFEKAVDYHEQALTISREVKDWDGEGRALNSLGIAYRKLGRYEKAAEYFEQALALHRKNKDRAGEGIVLNNLSGVYANQDRYEKAIEYLEPALAIYRELKNRGYEGIALSNLGYFYLNLERFEKAIEYHEQALAIKREVKDRDGEGASLHNLGDDYYGMKRYEKAIEYLEQALAIQREVKNRDGEADILYSLARVERDMNNFPAARARIDESLMVAESMRLEILSPASRASYLAVVQTSYQFYTDLLMRQHKAEPTMGFDALAVEVSERQRARSLLDLLAESGTDLRQGIAPALIEREETLAKQLNEKAQALTQAAKPEQIAALKQEISQLENDLERAQSEIRKASPQYATLTQTQPLKLTEIQAQLDDDTLLLEYSLGEERSYLWAITKDTLTSYELPKEEEIKKSALAVYEMLTARNTKKSGETAVQRTSRIADAEAKLSAATRALSDLLLAPAAAQLGNKRLVIVADGALQYIPFAMLPEPVGRGAVGSGQKAAGRTKIAYNYQPLVVDHEVISLPSASALAIQRTELAGRQPAPKMLAVIADPVFDRTDARFKTSAPETIDKSARPQTVGAADTRGLEHIADTADDKSGKLVIRRLLFTRQEADGLLALTPKASSFRAMDFEASRVNVLNGDLSQYRYVHFATHGLLDTERPGLSSLVLSTIDADGKPQNGFLRANDIYNMKLPAELVVLSACQTGLGKEVKGEGLIGLTRGFMYAGARRVVVSLWSVNDKATSDLMTKFYRGMLKDNERPAAALRAAQIAMWKQKQWQSPYYWAAFTMQGEWR